MMENPSQRAKYEGSERPYLEVLGDHGERALKDGLKDAGHLILHLLPQFVDDGSKQAQDLRIPAHPSQIP